jgi:tRNA threonylcarbamoyladenosine biosynthesis protein TsaE
MEPVLAGSLASRSTRETERLGRALGELLGPGQVVGLVGELGAGKTCLVRGVAAGLGVDPSVPVASPTFTLVNEHPGRLTLYHIDLYRLGLPEELAEIGVHDCYRGEGVCLVEWFDRFPEERPPEFLLVELLVSGERRRRLQVSARGAAALALAHRWLEACCSHPR